MQNIQEDKTEEFNKFFAYLLEKYKIIIDGFYLKYSIRSIKILARIISI